jgi:hypothetical protein
MTQSPSCAVLGCGKSASWVKRNKDGTKKYRNTCSKHHKMDLKLTKKDYCENVDGRLGFTCTSTILNPCQLQLDHIDGNKFNNDPANHQTLCACCHAYKTHQEKNHLKRYNKKVKTTFTSIFQYI